MKEPVFGSEDVSLGFCVGMVHAILWGVGRSTKASLVLVAIYSRSDTLPPSERALQIDAAKIMVFFRC